MLPEEPSATRCLLYLPSATGVCIMSGRCHHHLPEAVPVKENLAFTPEHASPFARAMRANLWTCVLLVAWCKDTSQ